MFLVSSQTLSPFLNGVKVFFLRSAIRLLASLCAASASSLSANSHFIFSSIVGYFVCSKEVGIAIGESPNISSKGVFCRSACLRLLCVNSIIVKDFVHVSGWEEQ